MNITWADLKEKLDKMTEDELQSNISIYDEERDEVFPARKVNTVDEASGIDDILDDGETYLLF